jgi:hypothetical protein
MAFKDVKERHQIDSQHVYSVIRASVWSCDMQRNCCRKWATVVFALAKNNGHTQQTPRNRKRRGSCEIAFPVFESDPAL